MPDINVVIVDPGGYRFDQLLDSYMAMRALVPLLVQRLGLPDELKYQLIPRATGEPMQVTDTLSSIGASPGAEIDLRPVRDDVFVRIVEGLRKKAEGYVVDQLWAPAKEQLDKLFRIDPENREAKQLQSQLAIHIDITAPTPLPVFTGAAAQPSAVAGQPASANQASSAGCIIIAIIVGGVILYNKLPEKTKNSNQTYQTDQAYQPNPTDQTYQMDQTKGSFRAQMFRSGNSYYITVTAANPGERFLVTVRGTDQYKEDFRGVGSLSTSVIPLPKVSGVIDNVIVESLDTREKQPFTFVFP